MHSTTLQYALGLASLLLAITSPASAQTKHGVIGMGIRMYKPVCCYACHDALSSLYLNCTTFSDHHDMEGMDMKLRKRMDMGGEAMAETSDECRASDQTWLATFAYCVNSHCTEEGVSAGARNQCFETLAAGSLPVPGLKESLPQQQPEEELAEDAEWLNTTQLVNAAAYADQRGTLSEFERSEEYHSRYSMIIWILTVGIPLLTGAYTFFKSNLAPKARSSLSRKLNQHLFLPALTGGRQLQPLPWKIGYAPSRILSLFIFFYVSLNIIFSAVSIQNYVPNIWFSTAKSQTATYIANRTGVLSFANLGIAVLFSGRNNILIALTGWSQTTFLTFHRWASRVATLQAVIHSIIYTLTYFWSGGAAAYYAEVKMPYYWWGIIATVVMSVSVGLSILPIRLRAYEFFLISHIIFAILAIAGCWYHVDLRFKKRWGYEVWIYLAMAFWGFDRLVRFVRVAWYNEWAGSIASHVEKVPDSDFLQLTIFPGKRWISLAGPGKHTFLAFPGKLWESHPFTIADWGFLDRNAYKGIRTRSALSSGSSSSHGSLSEKVDEKTVASVQHTAIGGHESAQSETGDFYIRMLIRPHTGSTRSLLRKFSPSSPSIHHLRILTEGPYAGHSQTLHALRPADTVLCVAGGIGITFPLGFVKQYLEQRQSSSTPSGSKALLAKTSRFVLAWSAREQALIRHVSHHLLPADATKSGGLEVNVWHTGAGDAAVSNANFQVKSDEITATTESTPTDADSYRNITSLTTGSRMPIDSVVRSVLEPSRRIVVLVCAPGSLADDLRKSVVRAVGDGFDVDLIEEAFAW